MLLNSFSSLSSHISSAQFFAPIRSFPHFFQINCTRFYLHTFPHDLRLVLRRLFLTHQKVITMARPRTISDDDIRQAARAVFVEHGASAPVSLIAERLGVTHAALFGRAGTKDQLL